MIVKLNRHGSGHGQPKTENRKPKTESRKNRGEFSKFTPYYQKCCLFYQAYLQAQLSSIQFITLQMLVALLQKNLVDVLFTRALV